MPSRTSGISVPRLESVSTAISHQPDAVGVPAQRDREEVPA